MEVNLERLISIASPPFAREQPEPGRFREVNTSLTDELLAMLRLKNGFTAFESALVVFPTFNVGEILGLESWNSVAGWRQAYKGHLPKDLLFFAHDLFGGQFGITEKAVVKFDPETGEIWHYADSLSKWAEKLLSNYAEDTGWPLAHEWQAKYGLLRAADRLLPKQPFILGGDFAVENLTLTDSVDAMENWGRLFQAIQSIPDGHKVSLTGWLQ